MRSLIVLLSFILVMPVFAAGLGDLDLETNRYASIVATDTGEAQTLGATVIAPVDLIKFRFHTGSIKRRIHRLKLLVVNSVSIPYWFD